MPKTKNKPLSQSSTKAAQQLLDRRVAGANASCLDDHCKPNNIEEALAVQQRMIQLGLASKVGVSAWKCLLPIADDKIIIAPIFDDTIQKIDDSNVCVLFKDDGKAKVEPEIVFVLNQDLPACSKGYSKKQITDAIGSAHMALELIQKRYANNENPAFAELLADCLSNQGLFIGPEIDKQKAFAASNIKISFKQRDKKGEVNVQYFDGAHPNILPQLPLYWAIDYMTKRGTGFKKGDALTTGSYAGVVELDFDKKTEIQYEGLGAFSLILHEKR